MEKQMRHETETGCCTGCMTFGVKGAPTGTKGW